MNGKWLKRMTNLRLIKFLPYRRKRRRNTMIYSLIGSGIMGAAVYLGFTRGKNVKGMNIKGTFQNMTKRFNPA